VLDGADEIAQSVVNSAWRVFDINNPDTFPQTPSPMLCMTNEIKGGVTMLSCFKINGRYGWLDGDLDVFDNVTHYADPNDLLYVPQQKDGS